MLSVSVVINTYNRAAHLENAIRSVLCQRYSLFEVIVVNGPSSDETSAVLERYADRIRILTCSLRNLSVSRNIGLAAASGDIVAFIDDDAIAEPYWLSHLTLGYDSSDIAGVGGYILDPSGVQFQCRVVVCDLFGDNEGFDDPGAVRFITLDPQRRDFKFFSTTGCNASFRRQTLIELGGFDPVYAYFLEETDVCLRLMKAGFRIGFSPTALVHHKFAGSHLRSEDRVPKNFFVPTCSKTYFALQHALPAHGLATVEAYLDRFRRARERDVSYFEKGGCLSADEAHSLRKQLADGMDAGRQSYESQRGGVREDKMLQSDGMRAARSNRVHILTERSAGRPALSVCLVSQQLPPQECGGIGVWTSHAARQLAKMGCIATVVTRGPKRSIHWDNGVWVHRIPDVDPSCVRGTRPHLLPGPLEHRNEVVCDEVLHVVGTRSVDVVSVPIWDLEGYPLLETPGICAVLSLHTSYGLALPSKLDWQSAPNYLSSHIRPIIENEKRALEIAPAILANSVSILTDLEELHQIRIDRNRVWIVPHGIVDRASTEEHETPIHPASNRKPVRILFVGRLEKRKGIDTFLGAAEALSGRRADVTFDAVGEDPGDGSVAYQALEKLRGTNHLRLHGRVDEATLHRLYESADIVVLPSRYESFGLTVIEAMMHSKPVVSRAVGGIKEIIEHDRNGVLLNSETISDWASAIEHLIERADQRREIGRAARKRFEAEYTADQMGKKLVAAYSEMSLRACSRWNPIP